MLLADVIYYAQHQYTYNRRRARFVLLDTSIVREFIIVRVNVTVTAKCFTDDTHQRTTASGRAGGP